MYRKILIGLLVSTAAIHSMESNEEQHLINKFRTNMSQENVKNIFKKAAEFKNIDSSKEFLGKIFEKLSKDELSFVEKNKQLYGQVEPKPSFTEIAAIHQYISNYKPSAAPVGRIKEWAPLQKKTVERSNVKVEKLEIPECFKKISEKSELRRLSSHQSFGPQEQISVSSRADQQPSLDANTVKISIQKDLNDLKDPVFLNKVNDFLKKMLEEFKQDDKKKKQIQDLNKKFETCKQQLSDSEKKITAGNNNLDTAQMIISVLSEDIDGMGHLNKEIKNTVSGKEFSQEYLDKLLSVINTHGTPELKKGANEQIPGARNFLKDALENYAKAQEEMQNLSREMVSIMDEIESL